MYKQLVNEAILELAIKPDGPILIKAGETGGLDPSHPDMEFVRTLHEVYIPGSSLKGVIRAHSERIVRTLQPQAGAGRGACDPLAREKEASCGKQLEDEEASEIRYKQSCLICRLFGNTTLAGRVHFADALPAGKVTIEERNGVAIDRIYGSVAVGPFNYEVVTRGTFKTRISLRNFTLPQLALVGLALRDLGEGRISLGFGKSRGLGRVTIDWGRLEIRYPLAGLKHQHLEAEMLHGVGALVAPDVAQRYSLSGDDRIQLPAGLRFAEDAWGTLRLVAEGSGQVQEIFRAVVGRWRQEVSRG
ncbi:MAG: hypothetical protein KatS3mg057_1155 [Herpetosiphonaceae bacterium]|nr:MAG: hypothetical protein KatS3mg057_1155 [Herpetosiphonaceae bacterium]